MTMNRLKIALTIFALLFLGLPGCQDEYFPKLDQVEPLLVVKGFITNGEGPFLIRLGLSVRFQDPQVFNGVSGAEVSIHADDGSQVSLNEISPGYYQTPEGFSGEVGKAYTLHINTPDGHQYVSLPQEILPPMTVDSIYGTRGDKVHYKTSSVSSTLYQTLITGTYAFIKTSGPGEQQTWFRYTADLYVQHGFAVSDYEFWSCWIKRPITEYQTTDLGFFSDIDGTSQEVAFVPLLANGLPWVGFIDGLLYGQVRVVTNKLYTLNAEAYQFHKAKNEQLSAEGRIFDPISVQIPGNILCITDPAISALGFFEASSEITFSYRVVASLSQPNVTIIPAPAIDTIPDEGCVMNSYPPFWIN